MAAAYRSHSATTYATRTNTTITAPAGIQDGDVLLLAFLVGGGSPPTPTLPSGFTLLSGYPSTVTDAGFSVTLRVAYKVASSESGDYTVSHSSAPSQGLMIAVSGASGTVQGTVATGIGQTSTATGLTTGADDSFVAFLAHNWELYGAASPPTGSTPTFTERLDSSSSLMYYADGVLATAAATGNKSHTNLNIYTSEPWQAALVEVRAAAGAGPTLRNLALLGVG